jgi:hypothetical protein
VVIFCCGLMFWLSMIKRSVIRDSMRLRMPIVLLTSIFSTRSEQNLSRYSVRLVYVTLSSWVCRLLKSSTASLC